LTPLPGVGVSLAEVAVVKTRSIATKVALVVSAVVIGALALTGWFALKRSDAELVQLQLNQASQQLTIKLGIAQRILEDAFAVAAAGGSCALSAGGGRTGHPHTQLFKGDEPVLRQPRGDRPPWSSRLTAPSSASAAVGTSWWSDGHRRLRDPHGRPADF
jgi:hypothetical protein